MLVCLPSIQTQVVRGAKPSSSSPSHRPQAEAAALSQAAPLPDTASRDASAQPLTLKEIRRSVSNESGGSVPDAAEGVDAEPRVMPDTCLPSSASFLVVTGANCARDPCKAISEARPTHPSVVRLFQRRSTAIQELADNDEAGELPPMMGFLADIPRVMPLSSRISYVSSLTSDHDEREVGLFESDIDRIARGEDFR